MTFSVDLCQSWDRIGQLQADAYEFHGVERYRELGEWSLAFPDGAPSWSSRKVPDLPNFLDWSTGHAQSVDSAQLDVTGDIDVRWFGTLTDWDNATSQALFNKFDAAGNQRSWLIRCESTGVRFYVSTDGTNQPASTAIPVPFSNGEYGGIRFTRVQSSGVATCYFSDDGVTWAAQTPTTVLSAGSALFNSSALTIIGGFTDGLGSPPTGRAVFAELWNGIEGSGGSLVASPDFSDLVEGRALAFEPLGDAQGNIWTGGGASFAARVGSDSEIVPFGPRDVDTIRLVEDNQIRFAGFVGEPSQGAGGVERLLDASGIHWSMSGPDLWDTLRSRVAFPVPATATPSSWASSHDVNTGVASTALATYLSDNAGVTALADRAIAGFSVVDATAGISGTWSARLQSLYELARRILDDAELTIHWTVSFDGAIVASIEQPRDLSEIHTLSDQADLVSVRSRLVPARSTWVLAGGTGTGTGRTFRHSDSGATGLPRRERFIDVSSLSEASEVQATATANQRLDAETWVTTGEVADSVTEAIGFGRSVFVGDRVTIQAAGERFVVPVASIAWHIASERQVIRPTLGEATPDALDGLLRDVADLAARFDNQIA